MPGASGSGAAGRRQEAAQAHSCSCPYCGEVEEAEILDVYAGGEFQIATCCQGKLEEITEFLNEDPKAAAKWLSGELDLDALCGQRLRRVIDDGCGQLLLDWNLEITKLEWAQVKAFVEQHHAHCAAPVGWRFGAGIRNGFQLIGVVSVGRAVARGFDPDTVVEVNRNCVRRDIAPELVWNACSKLYGWAARQARKRGFEKIITYTLATEDATTLRAAGWEFDGVVPARSRGWRNNVPTVEKHRWVCQLRRAPRALPRQVQGNHPAARRRPASELVLQPA